LTADASDGRTREPGAPRLSVVVATFNRPASAARLLRQLAAQTLPPDQYEVVIVDDGSAEPVSTWLSRVEAPCRVKSVRQDNAGAAAARHRGVLEARGEILVVTDDDMEVPAEFLAAHLARHVQGSRRVVVGRIRSPATLSERPLFERFHADRLDRWSARPLRADSVCTGNVSLRRADYLQVGGFDVSLARAEDIDLGLRLEQAQVEIVFAEEAFSIHDSDHTDFPAWRRQARNYGRHFVRIGRKFPRNPNADPWRFFFGNALVKRPFLSLALAAPRLGGALADAALRMALGADRLGLERLALRLTSLIWDVEYSRGVREETGGLGVTVRSCAEFLEKAESAGEPMPGVGRVHLWLGRVVRGLFPSRGRDGEARC
jgi:GT2 family glycosyltransferase